MRSSANMVYNDKKFQIEIREKMRSLQGYAWFFRKGLSRKIFIWIFRIQFTITYDLLWKNSIKIQTKFFFSFSNELMTDINPLHEQLYNIQLLILNIFSKMILKFFN